MSKFFVFVVCIFMFQSSLHALWFKNDTDEPVNCMIRLNKTGESGIFYEVDLENVQPEGEGKLRQLNSRKTRDFFYAQETLHEAREEFSQVREDYLKAQEDSRKDPRKRPIFLEKQIAFLKKKQTLSEIEERLKTEESSLEGIIRITKYCGNSNNAQGERPVIYEQRICLKTGMDLTYWSDLAVGRLFQEDDQYTFTLNPTPNQ